MTFEKYDEKQKQKSIEEEEQERVVYVDSDGQKIADSDINKSTIPESFANIEFNSRNPLVIFSHGIETSAI